MAIILAFIQLVQVFALISLALWLCESSVYTRFQLLLCGVHEAIEACGSDGIKVTVITGDKKSTTEAIFREITLFREVEDLKFTNYTGNEFTSLSSTMQKENL